jgi:hypothetical protein
MNFAKKGILFAPDQKEFWRQSHAALPTALQTGPEEYIIYYTSRDKDNKTYVGAFAWSPKKPLQAQNISDSPLLSPGRLGCFDAFGVQATSVVRHGSDIYLYYLGWVLGQPAPLFYTAIGLAISTDGGYTFKKYSEAPIMERSPYDPWMVSGGTVVKEQNEWRMYYLSGMSFEINGNAESRYDIKLATSDDGIAWKRKGQVILPLQDNETNISRMSIVRDMDIWKAWFPVKRKDANYRCGYAESTDGIQFRRMDDKSGIGVSEKGWDDGAIDKMEVIRNNGKFYMFYNGNSFGRDGIGLAVYES